MDLKELNGLWIPQIDNQLFNHILSNWDRVAKPLNGLGDFEKITARIGAILGDPQIDISKRAVVMMCADNGIIEEGVSQSGSDVTTAVAALMGREMSSVCKMARVAGATTFPVDIGIKDAIEINGVISRKIRNGTRNFIIEPAMTEDEVLEAIETGMDIVKDLKKNGFSMIATGEMGIGNTTTSSAVLAGLLKLSGELVAGRGAGLSDSGLTRKISVIDEAVSKYDLHNISAFECLKNVGGLDIAGLCGVFIGGGLYGIPVVIDGLISGVAALLAERICPGVKEYCIPSHSGAEKGISLVLKELGLSPIINGNMALGEGTGAVMIFPLLDMSLSLYRDGVKFADTSIGQYVRMN